MGAVRTFPREDIGRESPELVMGVAGLTLEAIGTPCDKEEGEMDPISTTMLEVGHA